MPDVRVRATCPADLEFVHLVIAILDKDVGKTDRMGQVIMNLKDYCGDGSGKPVPFNLPVVLAGATHGFIAGAIQIVFPGTAAAEVASKNVFKGNAGCCSLA